VQDLAQDSRPQPTRSRFGGLWTDRLDALDVLIARRSSLAPRLVALLESWITNGFVLLPGAVDPSVCDSLAANLEQSWQHGHPGQLVVDSTTGQHRPLVAGDVKRLTRAVDTHVHFDAARQLLQSQVVNTFLTEVFGADPLFFQTLVFEVGSEQGLHQDTAFVVVDRPLEMVGVWFALEDVTLGSGELQYVPGSHRLSDHCFGPDRRYFDPGVDGHDAHDAYYPLMAQRCAEAGLTTQRFLPQKGDVLIWSADLVHGGAPITNPTSTRRSLVAHACPQTANPHFFSYLPGNRVTLPVPGTSSRYASQYHVLSA
jgi:phytanoyl-CoA hydroxylase